MMISIYIYMNFYIYFLISHNFSSVVQVFVVTVIFFFFLIHANIKVTLLSTSFEKSLFAWHFTQKK